MPPGSLRALTLLVFFPCFAGCRTPSDATPSAPPRHATTSARAPQTPHQVRPDHPPPPEPAVPEAPRLLADGYDLLGDVRARHEAARTELGPTTRLTTLREVFVLASAPGTDARTFSSTVGTVEQTLAAYFNGRFATPPPRALSIYLYASGDQYHAYCRRRWQRECFTPYGFYLPTERIIVMNLSLGIGTLTHELVHPILEADFPSAPKWIDEGIASLYERFGFTGPGEISGYTNWRLPRLRSALEGQDRSAAQLSQLFGMDDATFRGPGEDLHYAMARYFCQWLDHQGKLWPFYHRWRDHFADDPSGRASFEAVMGASPETFDEPFARWVRGL